ncbi:MAG: PAS domain-containing protein [Myxococcales bacterium]|jgi:signal transduction histidine kinase|nr:PAS domain-containing protein [Myxococcales bacterium]
MRGPKHCHADSLAALTAGVLVVDEGGAVSYANPGAGRILRRAPEEIVGARVEDVLAPIDPLRGGDAGEARRESTVRLPDGSTTVVGFSASAAASDGSRTVLFQEISNVLELRRERDRLLQMAALGDALPSMLHELRNPLAAMTSMLEVLIEDADERIRPDLHAVLWEVRRMNLTLQGVGGLVRPVHADQHVSVDLAVSEACRILEPSAARCGVKLDARVPPMPLLPLDWGVVSGVVFNLVKNAIEACSEGDTITVSAGLEQGDSFALRVHDTGVGMTDEVRRRCCDLFFTSKEKGSGIGLALCQQIADTSGGRLDIESTPGVGTTITMRVPLQPQKN